ncbi:MAG: prepilin peptidase [Acetatifactor sp.]|nr:prepilin peptidase [Acetatifactor sp.]
MVMCLFLSLACLFDYSLRKIPNFLVILMAAAGIGRFVIRGDYSALFTCAPAGLITLMIAFPIYRLGMIGAGDLKTVALCSLFLGRSMYLRFIIFTLFIAAIFSIAKLLIKHNSIERMKYFWEYLEDVIRNRAFGLYMNNKETDRDATICLMGPVLISAVAVLCGL